MSFIPRGPKGGGVTKNISIGDPEVQWLASTLRIFQDMGMSIEYAVRLILGEGLYRFYDSSMGLYF